MDKKTIRQLIKILKTAKSLALETSSCDTMPEVYENYFKEGMKVGFDSCIFQLKEELGVNRED